MKKLEITFLDEYFSFKKGERFEFQGDLIILSGINGSGKSQLLNAAAVETIENDVNKFGHLHRHVKPVVNICIDGQQIKPFLNTKLLSFNEPLKYRSNFLRASNAKSRGMNDQIINFYKNKIFGKSSQLTNIETYDNPIFHEDNSLRNGFDAPLLKNYRQIKEAIKYWKDEYGDDFDKLMTEQEIMLPIPIDFDLNQNENNPNNNLINRLSNIFLKYALHETSIYKKESLKQKKDFDHDNFIILSNTNAPWTKLNKLFSQLNLNLKFADKYEHTDDFTSLTEDVFLRDIKSGIAREIKYLSDGEKTLLDLALFSFEMPPKETKLLLLDEYDAFLNPSIIHSFYWILDEYFKNFQIVLVTHHLTTIFRAPPKAKFYELVVDQNGNHRVVSVAREQYTDMKSFVDNLSIKDRASFLDSKLCIVSEGHNKEIIQHVLKNIFPFDGSQNIPVYNGGGVDELINNFDWYKTLNKKVMFVWDCDAELDGNISDFAAEHKNEINDGTIILYTFDHNGNNDNCEKGIENMFSKEITSRFNNVKQNNSKMTKSSKRKFLKYILSQRDKEIFKNFGPFVENVKKYL